MENKQTAVEWLVKQLTETINYDDSANAEDLRIKLYSLIINVEKQAKAMERQQIMYALSYCIEEEYYNKTYANCASVSLQAQEYYFDIFIQNTND